MVVNSSNCLTLIRFPPLSLKYSKYFYALKYFAIEREGERERLFFCKICLHSMGTTQNFLNNFFTSANGCMKNMLLYKLRGASKARKTTRNSSRNAKGVKIYNCCSKFELQTQNERENQRICV